jgi:hypothetical protein
LMSINNRRIRDGLSTHESTSSNGLQATIGSDHGLNNAASP